MSEAVYDMLGVEWTEYKRKLHRICILTHAQALLDAICDELGGCPPDDLAEVVETWIDRHVGRDLEQRIRAARRAPGGGGADGPWGQLLRLFFSPDKLGRQIARSLEAICAAWRHGDDARARAILWTVLSQYFYEAKFEIDGSSGQHRLRNWTRIRRLMHQVQQDWERASAELGAAERRWAERRRDDPAELAAAILAASQRPDAPCRLDDLSSVDGVLAYLYAFLPHLNIGDMENDPALADYLPSDLAETIGYYIDNPDSPAGLSDDERAALILEYREEIAPMSDQVFKQTYGHTRQTHRNRVAAGVRKIAPWVRRDLES